MEVEFGACGREELLGLGGGEDADGVEPGLAISGGLRSKYQPPWELLGEHIYVFENRSHCSWDAGSVGLGMGRAGSSLVGGKLEPRSMEVTAEWLSISDQNSGGEVTACGLRSRVNRLRV